MFEMSSFLFHSGPKSLPLFVDSIINDILQQSVPCVSQALLQIGHLSNWRLINTILHNTSYSIVYGVLSLQEYLEAISLEQWILEFHT